MKAPFHPRIKDPRKAWQVNEDPEKLDKMYIKFLGKGGDKVLTDEIKWLAVTHKSFDQGRRGFNDRLAFFGEIFARIHVALSLLTFRQTHASPPRNTRHATFSSHYCNPNYCT
jgi:large subunit ribosomal protein L15